MFRFTEFGDVSNLYDNSIKYYTPVFGGVQGSVMYAAGEATTSTDGSSMGEAKVTYGSGPFNAMLSYHAGKDGAGNRTDRLTTGGVNLTMGPVRARAAYAVAKYVSLASDASSYDIGADFTVTPPRPVTRLRVARQEEEP